MSNTPEANERRKAHYHANKNKPEYRARRLELAKKLRDKHPDRQRAYNKKCNLKKGMDVVRSRWAEKRRMTIAEWRKSDPEGWKLHVRKSNLWIKYKITLDDYSAMEKTQDYKCAVCFEPFTEENYACVDHCHKTGKVRGILHNKCNAALGIMRDDADKIIKLAEYLRRHK